MCSKYAYHIYLLVYMMHIAHKVYSLGNYVGSFLFCSEYCLCCGKVCFGMPLCIDCRTLLKREAFLASFARCKRCGKVLLSEQSVCMACRTETILKDCDSVFPLCSYRLWKKNLVFEWKIHDRQILSEFFADLLSEALGKLYSARHIPVIVPVPPRKGKIRNRGWDQVEAVCQWLHKKYGFTVLHLLKNCSSEQQKKQNAVERLAAQHKFRPSRFFLNMKNHIDVPEEVVIIDDVITTGATVNACAAVLKNSGIIKVNVLSLFIVD